MRDVLDDLIGWWQAGETVGMGTVVATWRSAPRPAGASMDRRPGSRGWIKPFSIPMVMVPISPWPHMGRQPEVSMNRTATSQSGRVGA